MTMDRKTKGKLAILGSSFALFLAGVAALSMERGVARTVVLAAVFAGLAGMAAWVTARRMKERK